MDWQTLSEKLKSLGMQLGKEQQYQPAQVSKFPIDSILSGTIQETIFGEAFFTKNQYQSDHKHGKVNLIRPKDFDVLANYAKVPLIENTLIENIVFLDTETTGLAGGTGTFAFMIGVGRFNREGFVLNQYFLRQPAEEAAMLALLSQFLEPSAAVCTYNGKTFDIPLLNTRYIMQSMKSPFINLPHFDLLALARRLWRDRLVSCTLGNIEQQILGVFRTEQEVPGYLIPEMYTEYLRSGDARPMKGVFYHNAIDIISLAALFTHAANLLSDPLTQNISDGIDLASLARLFQSIGFKEQATEIFDESLRQELPEDIYKNTLLNNAKIFKQKNDYQKAITLWEAGAEVRSIDACVELAMYSEHKIKNYELALSWTCLAISYSEKDSTQQDTLLHRKLRLQKKLTNNHLT